MSEKCPLCGGKGIVKIAKSVRKNSADIKRAIAIKLKRNGHTMRQIQTLLGYKSPSTIHFLLKQ